MIERVEHPPRVTFDVEPESVLAVAEMPDTVQNDLRQVLVAVADRNGFRWESAMGHGAIVGLSEKITEKFEVVAPKCDPQMCNRHIEIVASVLDPEEAMLTIECPLKSFESEEEAQQAEERCIQTHRNISERFGTFVAGMTQDITTIGRDLQVAQANVRSTNEELDRLLK